LYVVQKDRHPLNLVYDNQGFAVERHEPFPKKPRRLFEFKLFFRVEEIYVKIGF
jgi:hypothetical protein